MNRLQTLLSQNLLTVNDIASTFDHSLLAPTLTDAAMRKDLESVRSYPLASVCIKPYAVPLAAEALAKTEIATCTVIGFPHGSNLPEIKAAEARVAFAQGATEMDMVVNVGKVLSEDWDYVREDIRAVLEVVRNNSGILKVIFETDYVTADRAKIRLCEICSDLKADFVKTSTGFGFVKGADGGHRYTGATEHDLRLMRDHCDPTVGLKASGGVRSLEMVLKCIELGCTRIGVSATKALLAEAEKGGFAGKVANEHAGY